MKKIVFSFLFLFSTLIQAQTTTISSGRLSISVNIAGNGVQLLSIKDNGTEVLNAGAVSNFFTLRLKNINTNAIKTLSSQTAWGTISIPSNTSSCSIQLSNPIGADLPANLAAIITIETNGEKSSWDLSVTGLGADYSLMEVLFPQLNIKAEGNDYFLLPYYTGKLIETPGNGIDYFDDPNINTTADNLIGIYPRGWSTTMQFLSYYNDNYGLYFGFHDPDAALKQFQVVNRNGGVSVFCKFPAPNKSIAGNDWQLPGVFQLDSFNGDWYDAALRYKAWASVRAGYWPQNTVERRARQAVIGDIGIWAYNFIKLDGNNVAATENFINQFADFMDTPVGFHLYEWYNLPHDNDYPDYSNVISGFAQMVSNTQNGNSNIHIMPYINGRLWDIDLTGGIFDYNTQGFPYTTRKSDDTAYTQTFTNHNYNITNTFGVMCPTQAPWQNIITNESYEVTETLGCSGIYIDQVGCSSPVQCMKANHQHTLGGGDYWRGGYKHMFENIHTALSNNKFVTVEGGCDYLADEVDGFMVQGWLSDHLVPAFTVVYGGRVQLFGTQTGTSHYGDQQFYAKLAHGFAHGIQTGRMSIWLGINPSANANKLMAANYVKTLGKMRHRLKDFMSFGEMKRPITIAENTPVTLSYTVRDIGAGLSNVPVSISSIQKSVWKKDNAVALIFENARIQSPPGVSGGNLDFSFLFNPDNYGLTGALTIQEITPDSDGAIVAFDAANPKNVSLPNLGIVAYIITGEATQSVPETEISKIDIYPNPTESTFFIKTNENVSKVNIYNNLGQMVLTVKPVGRQVSIPGLKSGFYVVSIEIKTGKYLKKLLVK